MRSLLFVIASFAVTIFCWGMYGPVLHWGQADMVTDAGLAAGEKYARLRPFICVGLAYFLIGVVVPAVILVTRGEHGRWTSGGAVLSLLAGALGAVGALGIILAFNFGGKPVFVMPLVFGGAPVVNAFLTIFMAGKLREIGPLFQTGLIMVLMGAVVVMVWAPKKADQPSPTPQATAADVVDATGADSPATTGPIGNDLTRFVLRLLSIATTVVCWGAYGPVLHKGQAAMQQSRLRPLLCVGVAYFAIAVIVPNLILLVSPEMSEWNFTGTMWSMLAGAAGAVGALGIIMAFNFGGKPVYVMPLVFGGAPVVNTLATTFFSGLWGEVGPMFLAGLILVIAGAAMVLVFAPRAAPPPRPVPASEPPEPQPKEEPAVEEAP